MVWVGMLGIGDWTLLIDSAKKSLFTTPQFSAFSSKRDNSNLKVCDTYGIGCIKFGWGGMKRALDIITDENLGKRGDGS